MSHKAYDSISSSYLDYNHFYSFKKLNSPLVGCYGKKTFRVHYQCTNHQ